MSNEIVEVRAPEEQEEGTRSQLLRWLKAPGDSVSAHEPLVELETDKVTVEVAAPVSGVLAEVLKDEREEVAPGDVLGRIATGAEVPRSAAHTPQPSAPEARALPGAAARPAAASLAAHPASGASTACSPAVRRLLAERGLESADVRGTGPAGRITVDDVLSVAARSRESASVPPPQTEPSGIAVRRVEHSAVRQRIAARMVESLLHTAPHVTTVFEVDLTAVLDHRERHRESFAKRGTPLTLSAYFVRAAVAAIEEVPEANSRWSEAALEIYQSVNFGIGTAAPEGLVAPVLRRAETLDLEQTAQGIDALVQRARAGRLSPEDVRGGTFTMSNHGVSGSLIATPIILFPGQAAILGVGKLEKRAAVVQHGETERIEIRPRCYATLTIDHRVMDGVRANRFMQIFAERLGLWSE
ncbi:MAG: dihydrolipoamide acetyltransferase family protein [Steroidobacteraceae bacterium]